MVDRKWHAVYTRPGREKKVAGVLAKKKILNYLPIRKIQEQVNGRKKEIEHALFPGFVFISFDGKDQDPFKQSRDIINYVYWLDKPVEIQNDEINAIKLFLNEYSCTRLERTPVKPHEDFRVDNELHLHRKGNLIEANIATVKLMLPSLGRILVAEIRKEKTEEFTHARDSMIRSIIGS